MAYELLRNYKVALLKAETKLKKFKFNAKINFIDFLTA